MPGVTAPADFASLCSTLYGPYVDVEALWTEVSKLNPGPSDVHTPAAPRRKHKDDEPSAWKRNVALATNAAGAVLGPAAVATAFRNRAGGGMPRTAMKLTGKLRPNNPVARAGRALDKPASPRQKRVATVAGVGLVGGQVANMGGDMIAAQEMNRQRRVANRKKAQAAGVAKIYVPKHGKLVQGRIKAMKLTRQATLDPDSVAPPPGSIRPNVPGNAPGPLTDGQRKAMGTGASVRAGIDQTLSSTPGKVAVGGTVAASYGAGRRKGRQKGIVEGYYAKADDVVWKGEFSKLDSDKRLAFGWASVVEVNGEPVIDRQGDYISIDDVEEAAYVYVQKSRVGGDMHRRVGGKDLAGADRPHHVADMVESMVFTPEKISKMGLPHDFPVGWWVGFKVHDDDAWAEVKKGNRTGFSIHGKGLRKDVDYDSLMGVR